MGVGKRLDARVVDKGQGLTGISAMKVPGPRLIRIRVLWDFFPCEGFGVEHVNICDHAALCDEAATLDERKQVRTGFP